MTRKQSARSAAWQLLRMVWSEGAFANLVWGNLLRSTSLGTADRAFATELGYGTLRHHGQLTTIVEAAGGRPSRDFDPEVWWVLLLGTHQLLHMRTPQHAAVNESVELVKQVGHAKASGVVNAILRKVARRSLESWLDELTKGLPDDEGRALRYAHPAWVVTQLRLALEREGAGGELDALLAAHNEPARVTGVMLPGLAEPSADDERTPFSPLGVYLRGDPRDDPRVASGVVRVQDEGSQLAALVAIQAPPVKEGELVVDACSGPGGKSAVLAGYAIPRGSTLLATELQPHRAQLVRESLAAFGDHPLLTVLSGDALELIHEQPRKPDRILLDAPCLGLGALRRRPEARWTKSPSDAENLLQIQRRLLDGCLDALAPGGVLTYVTCSPVVSETTQLIDAVATRGDVEIVDTPAILSSLSRRDLPDHRVGSAVQLWPHRHGTDAMFIQVLRKSPDSLEA